MATADKLVDDIFSWIQQQECCAQQLKKLANELESLREKCNASECVGSTVSVVGAACLVGAGVATLFTGGAAAPLLGVLGAVYGGAGVAVSVATQVTEHFMSSDTMKDAENQANRSCAIEEKIKQLFRKLKEERKAVDSDEESDEEDQYIIDQILSAMARRSGVVLRVNKSRVMHNEPLTYVYREQLQMRHMMVRIKPEVIVGLAGVLAFFTFQASGRKSRMLFLKGAEKLIKEFSKTGLQTAAKGGAMVVGGAVGLAFALPEAIRNWKEAVGKNHVTDASRSLRTKADEILKASRILKAELDDIKRIFDELAERQESKEFCQDTHTFSEEDSEDYETETDQDKGDQNEQTYCEQQKESDQQDRECESEEESKTDEECESEEESETDEKCESEEESETDEECESEEESETDEECESEEESETDEDCESEEESETDEDSSDVCENDEDPGVGIRMGLLNVRSLTKKTPKVLKLITKNNLDILLLTETWLRRKGGVKVLREASPENFSSYHQVRKRKRRGGGVAIQFSNALDCERRFFKFITSFEYVAMALLNDEWDAPIILVNVYYPPGYTMTQFRQFLDELTELFKEYDNIILTGDFNIHVDDGIKSSATEFEFLLLLYGLEQHVAMPTHRAGHTLDLVITRNVDISLLSVQDDGISDHYTLLFNAIPVSKDEKKTSKQKNDGKEESKRFKKKEE